MNGTSASSDMDMMETDVSSSASVNARTASPYDSVKSLLTIAREHIDQGRPEQALGAITVAMKQIGGEAAVIQTLQRARELYVQRVQTDSQADQLASLFAECAIAEAQPVSGELTSSLPAPNASAEAVVQSRSDLPLGLSPDVNGKSILAESGRKQVVMDAFDDGSSFICLKCGGLVSVYRKDEHLAYWCQS